MRILVCGSREFDDWLKLSSVLGDQPIDEIIEGGAIGADFLGRVYAKYIGKPSARFPADWKQYGKAAGNIRNKQMLLEGKPDKVIAFWDGHSPGTRNMIELVQKTHIPYEIIKDGW